MPDKERTIRLKTGFILKIHVHFIVQTLRYSYTFYLILFSTYFSMFMIQEDVCDFVNPCHITENLWYTAKEISNWWITEDPGTHSISSFISLVQFFSLRSLPIRRLHPTITGTQTFTHVKLVRHHSPPLVLILMVSGTFQALSFSSWKLGSHPRNLVLHQPPHSISNQVLPIMPPSVIPSPD